LSLTLAFGQVSSHAPTSFASAPAANGASAANTANAGNTAATPSPLQVTGKPVARINGTVLTDRDLLREMFALFPYARQHNGFPKAQEAEIRKGALQMIEFEELVYQEALRRKMTISPTRQQHAENDFMGQFNSRQEFEAYLQNEWKGSRAIMRRQIRRSLLIDDLLKQEVTGKSTVTLTEARGYYDKNPKQFTKPERFTFQSISIIPKDNASAEALKDARQQAEDAYKQAQATKNFEEFGLLAEKISQDDFRVDMGLHRDVATAKLPAEILNPMRAMKPSQISNLIQLGNAYTIFRLEAHDLETVTKFDDVKDDLRKNLRGRKQDILRAGLDRRLRQNAKVEEL
jgi:hypothetical protein